VCYTPSDHSSKFPMHASEVRASGREFAKSPRIAPQNQLPLLLFAFRLAAFYGIQLFTSGAEAGVSKCK